MSRFSQVLGVAILSCFFTGTSLAAPYGDLNCDYSVNIVDVQISILNALNSPLDPIIDGDQNGVPDTCDADPTGNCGVGTLFANGWCVLDPSYLSEATTNAYIEGYDDGLTAGQAENASYANGYDDALEMCVELGAEIGFCNNFGDSSALSTLSETDIQVMGQTCLAACLFSLNDPFCLNDCISAAAGISSPCANCFASEVDCTIQTCLDSCLDYLSEECSACKAEFGCDALTDKCTGLIPPPEPEPVGACENDNDLLLIDPDGFPDNANNCMANCVFSQDPVLCLTDCLQEGGLSSECSDCWAVYEACTVDACLTSCLSGLASESCLTCAYEAGCIEPLSACAWAVLPDPTGSETCDYYYYSCTGQCEDQECANQCYAALSPQAQGQVTEWSTCWLMADADEDGLWDSDGAYYLAGFFACADASGPCIPENGWNGGGNCGDILICVSECDLTDSECINTCIALLSEATAPVVSSLFTCILGYCGTSEEALTPDCIFESTGACLAEATACIQSTAGGGEETEQGCSDGLDNDEDGFIDCDDGGCANTLECSGQVPGCPIADIYIEEGDQVIPTTNLHLYSEGSYSPVGTPIESYEWKVTQPSGSWSQFDPADSFPFPMFGVNMAGTYIFELMVYDAEGVPSCAPAVATVVVIPDDEIHVELFWSTDGDDNPYDTGPEAGTDVDLHFTHPFASGPDLDGDGVPDGWFDQPFDAFWFNPNPQWGSFDPSVDDDPSVVMDDTDGWGPEIVTFNNPQAAYSYRVGVHYWHDHDYGSSVATIRIYYLGVLAFEWPDVELNNHDMWDVTKLQVTGGGIEFELQCDAATNQPCLPDITPEYQNPFFFQP